MATLLMDRACRRYLAAHAQSSIGDGVGYVALLLLAYQQWHSPWAVTLVLVADFVPAIGLGLWFGALADRCSRRRLAVAADVLRALAFAGIVLADSYAATVLLAGLAGIGTAMFRPAVSSALPTIAPPDRLGALTAAHRVLKDGGVTLGPALGAGLLLLVGSVEGLLALNAASFVLSAVLLAGVPLDRRRAAAGATEEAVAGDHTGSGAGAGGIREGFALVRRLRGAGTLVAAATATLLVTSGLNVVEPILSLDVLGAGQAGFAALVACYGVGMVLGGLSGARERHADALRAHYVRGLVLTGAGLAVSAAAPSVAVAAVGFALTGAGNAMYLVSDQQLLARMVPDRALGRVYGMKDTFESAAFAIGLLSAGVIVEVLGARAVFVLGAVGVVLVAAVTAVGLGVVGRRAAPEPAPAVA